MAVGTASVSIEDEAWPENRVFEADPGEHSRSRALVDFICLLRKHSDHLPEGIALAGGVVLFRAVGACQMGEGTLEPQPWQR